MTVIWVVAALALAAESGHEANAGRLPHCGNRVINEVAKRAGCTVGDTRCWTRSRGFCTDYVEKRLGAARAGRSMRLEDVPAEDVKKGDVAVFASRAHYAVVDRVVKDAKGRPIAVDLSEFNFGTCWVDPGAMVTEKYGVVNRRSGVPLLEVDGGFKRARAVAR